jgi:hypothetical protein
VVNSVMTSFEWWHRQCAVKPSESLVRRVPPSPRTTGAGDAPKTPVAATGTLRPTGGGDSPASSSSDGDASQVSAASSASLEHAARLLGVAAGTLGLELTSRVRVARGQAMRSPQGPVKASDARHAVAKALYGRMFDWLVQVRHCGDSRSLALSSVRMRFLPYVLTSPTHAPRSAQSFPHSHHPSTCAHALPHCSASTIRWPPPADSWRGAKGHRDRLRKLTPHLLRRTSGQVRALPRLARAPLVSSTFSASRFSSATRLSSCSSTSAMCVRSRAVRADRCLTRPYCRSASAAAAAPAAAASAGEAPAALQHARF